MPRPPAREETIGSPDAGPGPPEVESGSGHLLVAGTDVEDTPLELEQLTPEYIRLDAAAPDLTCTHSSSDGKCTAYENGKDHGQEEKADPDTEFGEF